MHACACARVEGSEGQVGESSIPQEAEEEGGMSNRPTQGHRQICAKINKKINHGASGTEAFAFLK